MVNVHHRYAVVGGRSVFYREAGDRARPAVVLLHGAPASSFMFRGLIPLLAGDYHVVAPDLLGFGLSDAPAVEEFDYTFDTLTDSVAALLDALVAGTPAGGLGPQRRDLRPGRSRGVP